MSVFYSLVTFLSSCQRKSSVFNTCWKFSKSLITNTHWLTFFLIIGCFRDFTINHIKPPYQINLAPKHSESFRGFSSNPSVLIVRTHKLEYGCQPIMTISGSCASGPCLHGGTCVTGSKQSSSSSSYICDCPSLFHGRHCERTNDACLLAPCYNGGR